MIVSPDECARQLLEAVPMVMRAIRAEMRRHRESDLSVPQFRALIYLNRHEGASLSDLAEHLGLTLPSMSKMINVLVVRNLVARCTDLGDRRRVVLTPTAGGRKAMESAYEVTRARLAERLAALPPCECATVMEAMKSLRSLFVHGHGVEEAVTA
ncbi:MAG: MarR family transcriptional regulator [Syntrophobacteraceae bacterium]|nr:MarR family transcriptional regulator [Syntrophobacteraceae bacterium]